MRASQKPGRTAFTIIELLVVIAVVGTVICLQAPAVQRTRDAANRQKTINDLKQAALSIHNCNGTFGRMPPAWGVFPPQRPGAAVTNTNGTLHYWLLPFIEADNVYKLASPAVAGAKAKVWTLSKVYSQVVPPYWTPADLTTNDGTVKLSGETPWGVGNIAANTRIFGGLKKNAKDDTWDGQARIPASIPDGTSNTIVFATRYASCGDGGSAWAGGNTTASLDNFTKSGAFFGSDIEDTPLTAAGYATSPPFQVAPDKKDGKNPCNPLFAQAYSADGIQVALGDGSTRTVSPRITPLTWGRACHPSDGNVLGTDW
jgi:prepilin-type N-terminal cleavage/methylation domain-containing protein